MTVSYFEALEGQIPVLEARQMMAWAQAALYPHASKEGAERMWQSWTDAATPPNPGAYRTADGRRPLFMLNGAAVDFAGLRRGLGAALAPGSLVA